MACVKEPKFHLKLIQLVHEVFSKEKLIRALNIHKLKRTLRTFPSEITSSHTLKKKVGRSLPAIYLWSVNDSSWIRQRVWVQDVSGPIVENSNLILFSQNEVLSGDPILSNTRYYSFTTLSLFSTYSCKVLPHSFHNNPINLLLLTSFFRLGNWGSKK